MGLNKKLFYTEKMSREYTITEALQELKLLSSKIEKLTTTTRFVCSVKSEDNVDLTTVLKDSSSNFQSILDLMERRAKIKAAIMQSNATTTIEIGNKTYTVAEAISTKEWTHDKKRLIDQLTSQKASVSNEVIRYNSDRQRKIDGLIERSLGTVNTGTNRSSNNYSEDIKAITEMYSKKNYIEIVDPIKVDDQIKKLQDELDSFVHSVDYKLSYINAITKIMI